MNSAPSRNDHVRGAPFRKTAPSAPPQTQPLRILVVEDDVVNQFVTRGLLEHAGHRVCVVSNGRLALEAVAEESFDLVLMDVQMPGMNGLETTTALRLLPKGRTLPVLATSANHQQEDRERFLAAGMSGFVDKPIDAKTLFREIDLVLGGAWSRATPGTATRRHRQRRIAELFRQEAPLLLAAVQQAIAAGDGSALTAAAHKLGGAVGHFAASNADACCRRLEALGCAGALTGASDALTELMTALAQMQPLLDDWIGQDELRG